MRILYIFRSLAVWGGIERVLVEKMNYLFSAYGFDVSILTTDQGQNSIPFLLNSGVYYEDLVVNFHHQYRHKGLYRVWDRFWRIHLFEKRISAKIEKMRPNVIVCTTADPIGSIAKVKGNIPLVVESHSIYSKTLVGNSIKQRYLTYFLKKKLKKATCIVSLTEGDAVEWRKYYDNVKVIPNVVRLSIKGFSTLSEKRVIFVGRFDYQKRPLEAIRIWQQVYPHFPEWHLDIYGEGEFQKDVEMMACQLNMNIHVHKPTKHIFDCYRNSSILISTSLFEPFGLVLPEAMSCGLPVVAYDSPYGPSDIIVNGKNGFLVANNDRIMFSNRLCQLMKDLSLRRSMGISARMASARFSATIIMPQWKDLFLSL